MKTDSNSVRSGYTLIEMSVAIAMSASVLVLTTKLIHKAMFLSSITRQYESQTQAMTHFGHDFRRHAQHAKNVTRTGDDAWLIRLDTGRQVSYEVISGNLRCDVKEGGLVVRHQQLRVVHPFAASIQQLENPPRLQLLLTRTDTPNDQPVTCEDRVTAVIGSRCKTKESDP